MKNHDNLFTALDFKLPFSWFIINQIFDGCQKINFFARKSFIITMMIMIIILTTECCRIVTVQLSTWPAPYMFLSCVPISGWIMCRHVLALQAITQYNIWSKKKRDASLNSVFFFPARAGVGSNPTAESSLLRFIECAGR